MIGADPESRRAFILTNTRLQSPPHTPELSLHLADEITPIWRMTEEALEEIGLPPPFWAFAWAGGQALALNAEANGVSADFTDQDLLNHPPPEADVILAGDICYEKPLAARVMAWLEAGARRGARVLIGDPGRSYFPREGLVRLAEYQVHTTRELEDMEVKRTAVWTFPPG